MHLKANRVTGMGEAACGWGGGGDAGSGADGGEGVDILLQSCCNGETRLPCIFWTQLKSKLEFTFYSESSATSENTLMTK